MRAFFKPRNLTLTIHTFIAFYAAFKFLLLLFEATSIWERWVFELTPASLMALPYTQLALLSTVVATTNASLHLSNRPGLHKASLLLTITMVVGLILGLRTSEAYFDDINLARLGVLGILLITVPLDHFGMLRERASYGAYAPTPESDYEMWGPEAPEEFDQVMDSVDEALGMLDTTQGGGASQEEVADRAANILEDLLSTISTPAEGQEETTVSLADQGEAERRRSLFENRLRQMDQRLASDPGDVDALFAKATYLAMRKQYDDATKALDEITRLSPYYPGVWHLKAKVYELMGDKAMAELCTKRARAME